MAGRRGRGVGRRAGRMPVRSQLLPSASRSSARSEGQSTEAAALAASSGAAPKAGGRAGSEGVRARARRGIARGAWVRGIALTPGQARRLVARLRDEPTAAIPASEFRALLEDAEDEAALQRDLVAWFRAALPPGSLVVAMANQRLLSHLPPDEAARMVQALAAIGMVKGASDLWFVWDARLGAPGNRGLAVVEVKRRVGGGPPTPEQEEFIARMRALGVVAGVARSHEEVEALLLEAGAPLRTRWPPTWGQGGGVEQGPSGDPRMECGARRLPPAAPRAHSTLE